MKTSLHEQSALHRDPLQALLPALSPGFSTTSATRGAVSRQVLVGDHEHPHRKSLKFSLSRLPENSANQINIRIYYFISRDFRSVSPRIQLTAPRRAGERRQSRREIIPLVISHLVTCSNEKQQYQQQWRRRQRQQRRNDAVFSRGYFYNTIAPHRPRLGTTQQSRNNTETPLDFAFVVFARVFLRS